ncbi:hypothetical protein [Cupriavidus alkaliphilus]|uniref:Nucleotidyltransferase-like protein n=1 Tax=Cupriavidus alkaliphilus TaxID=942866 RepID=A0A7W4V5J9_9BURK|nr:hypothetical protein [Cupriavidus alkaliphilus]MBB3005463.1 hypothetical protein [Cupriavidus alkaliphilus]
MRPAHDIAVIVDTVVRAGLSTDFPTIAIALGGSHGQKDNDDTSDVDIVFVVDVSDPLMAASKLKTTLESHLDVSGTLQSGPGWKDGFGCRFNYIYADGFKLELFVMSPSTLPKSHRVGRWKPLFGESALTKLAESVLPSLAPERLLSRAIFDFTYYVMSLRRHVSRGEMLSIDYVLAAFLATLLSIHQLKTRGIYDPAVSYKRVYRDGEIQQGDVAEIRAAMALPRETLESAAIAIERLVQLGERQLHEALGRYPSVQGEWDRSLAVLRACAGWTDAHSAAQGG